jgi:hypothetical protein
VCASLCRGPSNHQEGQEQCSLSVRVVGAVQGGWVGGQGCIARWVVQGKVVEQQPQMAPAAVRLLSMLHTLCPAGGAAASTW